jgi:predicted DCC family thiol-disulfide oxidoreductase YuxK
MNTTAESGWVLYDDACGFCRTWVPRFAATLAKRGFGIAPLQADWVREKLQLSEDELLQDVRLLLPNGDQIAGADVYRYCMRRIWWAGPIWLFAVLPGGRQVFDWSYRTFARNRYCVPPAG